MVDRLLKKLKKRIKRNKSDIDLIRSALLEIQRKEARSQQDLKDYHNWIISDALKTQNPVY